MLQRLQVLKPLHRHDDFSWAELEDGITTLQVLKPLHRHDDCEALPTWFIAPALQVLKPLHRHDDLKRPTYDAAWEEVAGTQAPAQA